MKIKQALPILKEFGYYLDNKSNSFIVKYSYLNWHICQMIYVELIEKLRNQQQLRHLVLTLYRNCIKDLKRKCIWINENKVLPTTKLEKEDLADWWKKIK